MNKKNVDRKLLIMICEMAIVKEENWNDRDSAAAQMGVGKLWALLNAGCKYEIVYSKKANEVSTNEDTIWVKVFYRGFSCMEEDSGLNYDLFYLPSLKTVSNNPGKDWY